MTRAPSPRPCWGAQARPSSARGHRPHRRRRLSRCRAAATARCAHAARRRSWPPRSRPPRRP
eukprot:3017381-Pyramimonas_sp.AAC.1